MKEGNESGQPTNTMQYERNLQSTTQRNLSPTATPGSGTWLKELQLRGRTLVLGGALWFGSPLFGEAQNPPTAAAAPKTIGKGAQEVKEDTGDLLKQAQNALQAGHGREAVALATKAVALEPQNARCYFIRAKIHELLGESPASIQDYTRVIELDAKAVDVFHYRGGEFFKTGQIEKSLKDFDRYIALRPDQAAHHWQRGIALYYANRFDEGKSQFDLHQTVNSSDVENAAWHFLCKARAGTSEKARRELLKIGPDSRPIMMDVFALYQGRIQPSDLLALVEKLPSGAQRQQADFYASLYLGLYHEALNESEKAKPHLIRAATLSTGFGYMGDVARVHAKLRLGADPTTKPR